MKNDTIAAIASGLTTSGIGIIRISGDAAVSIADKVLKFYGAKSLAQAETHTISHGYVSNEEENVDEVLAVLMRAPKSYTGEDVVEIQCHGGPFLMKKILDMVVEAGARLAEPGEFTKRAFLNGKLDLSQAEAVMELIDSKSEYAARTAMSNLSGRLSEKVSTIRAKIIYDSAFLEAALDDPEHISLDGFDERIIDTVEGALKEIDALIKEANEGKILREGIKTVILGRPNAGKSTLLNLLLGEERAIVTDIPGTTRDVLEESVRIGDISLRIVDTAGLRQTSDVVEKMGVDRALASAKDADLIIYMFDASHELLTEEINEIKESVKAPIIVLANKSDIAENVDKTSLNIDEPVIVFSAKEGYGRDELEKIICEKFYLNEINEGGELTMVNSRQKEALSAAKRSLLNVKEAVASGMPQDLYTVDLMDAYTELGKIIGESVSEDLVNEIFAKFCMGK